MSRADKQAAVAEIVDSFNDASGAVLTEYRGLSVEDLQELRRSLGTNAQYSVVKNTLASSLRPRSASPLRRPAHRPHRDRLHQG